MKRDDEAAGYRLARLQTLVLEELRTVLRDSVENPVLFSVHLATLVLSVDYRHARVHFSLPPAPGDPAARRRIVERALSGATPFLRAQLALAVELKRTPDLRFVFDGFVASAGDEEASA